MLRARSLFAVLAVASLVTACGSTSPTPVPSTAPASAAASAPASQAPAPSATPAASPSATTAPSASAAPSPSPSVDVAAAFNKAISDPLWAPHLEYTGTSTTSGKASPMTGSLDSSLGAFHAVAKVGATTVETISDGAKAFTKQYGVWFKAPSRNVTLATMLAATSGYTDSGVEARDGQQLHHMVLPAGTVVNAAAIGVATGGDAQVTLDGWADDSGTPVGFTINAIWTATVSGKKVARAVAVDVTVKTPAAPITLPTEDQVWAWKTSAINHYTTAYPSTWEYKKGTTKKADFFDGFDGTWAGMTHFSAQGLSLTGVVNYARNHAAKWAALTTVSIVSNTAIRLSGYPARLVIFKGKYKGQVRYQYDAITVHNGYVYELFLSFPRKPTPADLAIWNAFLSTYKLK